MTPEQLKLLQQLSEIGEVTYVKRGVTSLIKAISSMDKDALELILEDDVLYQDTTKEIFLQKLNDTFQLFKQNEDSKLIAIEGKCNSIICGNKNKGGVSFIGNVSGLYIDLIIENEEGAVKDIYECKDFCKNKNASIKQTRKLSLNIFVYEKKTFKPIQNYNKIDNETIEATNKLKQYNNSEITKEQIIKWVDDHEELYNSMNWMTWTNLPYRDQSHFNQVYIDIYKVYEFLFLEDKALKALEEFRTIEIENELPLLQWLAKFECLFDLLSFLHPDVVSEESMNSGIIILHKDYTAFFKTELLKNCIEVSGIFDTHYYVKLKKHSTLTKKEEEDLTPFDDDYEQKSSLKYHLKKRGLI
jgi:hypothetical protein